MRHCMEEADGGTGGWAGGKTPPSLRVDFHPYSSKLEPLPPPTATYLRLVPGDKPVASSCAPDLCRSHHASPSPPTSLPIAVYQNLI